MPTDKPIVDLDNTLWGGVLGEEGVNGIDLGKTLNGENYKAGDKKIPYQIVAEGKGADLVGARYEQLMPLALPNDNPENAFRVISGVTKGFPSRSPPGQKPIFMMSFAMCSPLNMCC